MVYEIPQELVYKEKIIFGLTIKQSLYSLLFGFILLIIFKLNVNFMYKLFLSIFPLSLGFMFIFTDIPNLALNYLNWLKFRNIRDLKKFLDLEEINDYIFRFRNKKLSIIKIDPTNFLIKNKQERELILISFQKFLNSLSFPIQIFIATDKLNLDYYLKNLEDKVSKENYKLFLEYKKHFQSIIDKGIINRSFYLVIPENELKLDTQIEIIKNSLGNLNLKYELLKNKELINCLSSIFNDLYQDSNKKISKDDYLFNKVSPSKMTNYRDYLKIDNDYVRIISIKNYPRTVDEGFLDKIVSLNGDFNISLHLESNSLDRTMVFLNKELQKQRADLWSLEQKQILNPSLEIKYRDTKKVLENLQKGNEKLFNVSMHIMCKSDNLEKLNFLTRKIESELNSILITPNIENYQQHLALISSMPFCFNELKIRRNITTKALSAFFPFTSRFLELDEEGIFLGLNKNKVPIIKDIFKLHNANGVILASSGGGKSYFTKLMISRLLLNKTKVIVIDPQSEYTKLVEKFNGELINISRNSDSIINSLDFMGHDYDEKKLTLLDLFKVMIGDLSEIQRAVLDKALTLTYESKGINQNLKTWNREPPIIQDLLKQLKKMSKKASKIELETYRSLINRIEMYVSGVFNFLNKQTNLNFNSNFVCFNIGDMPSQVKPVIMFLILDYVYMKMRKDKERKILVIDEAWSLLERTEDSSYIFKIVKTCRKFNLGLLLITQDVADLLKNDAGKALLNNSEYSLLLRQKPSIIDLVQKNFRLSNIERERLLTADKGEGVLIVSNDHSEIKIVSSPEEHKIITTNADEILNEVKFVTKFRKFNLNFKEGIYKKSKLKEGEIKELIENGFILKSLVGIYGGRAEDYLIKPRFNESCEHYFVVKLLEWYIKKFTKDVKLYITCEPDIVFNVNGKKIGIEVETGKRPISRMNEKIKVLKKYDDSFFVVVDWKDKYKYSKLGKAFVRKEIPSLIKEYFLGSNFDSRSFVNS